MKSSLNLRIWRFILEILNTFFCSISIVRIFLRIQVFIFTFWSKPRTFYLIFELASFSWNNFFRSSDPPKNPINPGIRESATTYSQLNVRYLKYNLDVSISINFLRMHITWADVQISDKTQILKLPKGVKKYKH